MCVFVASMTDQLSTSHKCHITVRALVWTSSLKKKGKYKLYLHCNDKRILPSSPVNVFTQTVNWSHVYRYVYWDGFLAKWLSWRLFHTGDICEVSHQCGSSYVCPGWSVEGTCSYTVHTEMSFSLLTNNKGNITENGDCADCKSSFSSCQWTFLMQQELTDHSTPTFCPIILFFFCFFLN